jgi:4-alpha-glucanotransferase
MFERGSGILLHPTSLPSRFGVGDLGPSAHRWIDWLAEAGQSVWQLLPLGPTGYGDSPYQCFSAFAGNPVLISPEELVKDGLLNPVDIESLPAFPPETVAYDEVNRYKFALLHRAFERFQETSGGSLKPDFGLSGEVASSNKGLGAALNPGLYDDLHNSFQSFKLSNALWLDDYALFMAIKNAHAGVLWTRWPREIALREAAPIEAWREGLARQIEERKFWQFLFFRQWAELRRHARERKVRIMGDLPIYVAQDSADVWAHPSLFWLTEDGEPEKIAGVPPDYFSATGQLWGNPIYRWDEHARTGFAWWIERFRASFELIDICRLDHFRGFAGYWEVPAGETTAIHGQWVKGPGPALFEAVEAQLGKLPIVAENLGVITKDVEALRNRFGYPGMAILQFAFGKDPMAPSFKPHNYPRNLVAYTGTHDNDTVVGWWTDVKADHSRGVEDIRRERDFTRKYLDLSAASTVSVGNPGDRSINWAFIRAVMASVADLALFPLQDVMGLGSAARMNRPGTASGNWRWRFRWEEIPAEAQPRLREYAEIYDRRG